jgi:hypothetical protein
MLIINYSLLVFINSIFFILFSTDKISFDFGLHFGSFVDHLMELDVILNHLIQLKPFGFKLLLFSLLLSIIHQLSLILFFTDKNLDVLFKPSDLINLNLFHFDLISSIVFQDFLKVFLLSLPSILNLFLSEIQILFNFPSLSIPKGHLIRPLPFLIPFNFILILSQRMIKTFIHFPDGLRIILGKRLDIFSHQKFILKHFLLFELFVNLDDIKLIVLHLFPLVKSVISGNLGIIAFLMRRIGKHYNGFSFV